MKIWKNPFVAAVARLVFGHVLPPLAYPVLAGPLRGARFVLGAFVGECRGASVYFNRMEKKQTLRMASALQQGQTFFDVGANAGYYTILASRMVGPSGRVVAFEPVMRNVHYLYRHVALNKADNVQIMPSACSDRMSIRLFSSGGNCATGHLDSDGGNGGSLPVSVISIDLFVQRTGVVPNMMKIDVEGSELSVLKGAQAVLRESKPSIFLSVHSAELREACLEYLAGLGYRHDVPENRIYRNSEFYLYC